MTLLSALTQPATNDLDFANRERFQFLIKANQALAKVGATADTLKAELDGAWQRYKPLVVVGPSGAGKGTLIARLTKKYPSQFGFSVSYTTRAARVGEEHGKHYYFVDHEKFKEKIANDDFIEYCQVHTNFYGTEKA